MDQRMPIQPVLLQYAYSFCSVTLPKTKREGKAGNGKLNLLFYCLAWCFTFTFTNITDAILMAILSPTMHKSSLVPSHYGVTRFFFTLITVTSYFSSHLISTITWLGEGSVIYVVPQIYRQHQKGSYTDATLSFTWLNIWEYQGATLLCLTQINILNCYVFFIPFASVSYYYI